MGSSRSLQLNEMADAFNALDGLLQALGRADEHRPNVAFSTTGLTLRRPRLGCDVRSAVTVAFGQVEGACKNLPPDFSSWWYGAP